MSFRDLLDTASAQALADKLWPTEESIWEKYCREFSIRFHTSLPLVYQLDPLFVVKQVNAFNLEDFNPEEQIDSLFEMLGSLSDPDYDIKKERAIREELLQIEERERLRLERGEAIHPSLKKDKRVITKDEPPQSKELPKSGGINMALLNKLNNQDKEG